MARARMISKSISTSEKVNRKLSERLKAEGLREVTKGTLLYTWLHPHADDFGRMDGSTYWLKLNVVPDQNITEKEIEKILKCLDEINLIQLYSNDPDKRYIQIINFEEHQSGLHKRTESKFPEPPGNSGKLSVEGKGREGKGSRI